MLKQTVRPSGRSSLKGPPGAPVWPCIKPNSYLQDLLRQSKPLGAGSHGQGAAGRFPGSNYTPMAPRSLIDEDNPEGSNRNI